MAETTNDYRLKILDNLLVTSHNTPDSIFPFHKEVIDTDPLFYARLACFYSYGKDAVGNVRDHTDMFTSCLIAHPDQELREVGLAILETLPPFQVERVINFVKGTKKDGKLVSGLGKNLPRSARTTVQNYLREREARQDWIDTTILTARKSLKRLYAVCHVAPSSYVQESLFLNRPPEGSRLADFKKLAKTADPAEQARLIIELKIPYRVASTIVKNMTPSVLLALIEVMSPQELINNMGALRKRGVFDNPELKEVVEKKLKKAQSAKNVSALKGMKAAEAAGLSEDLSEALQNVADKQVKSKGRIKIPTALLVDKSSSMGTAIDQGRQLAAMISTIMEDGVPFYCYAFDAMPYKIEAKENTLQGWTEAFKYIRPNGCTGIGCSLASMAKNNEKVSSIVVISDFCENQPPAFLKAYQEYSAKMNVKPTVHMIGCGVYSDDIYNKLVRAEVEVSKNMITSTDYYALPNLIQYLLKPTRLELLMEIMDTPLPKRKTRERKNEAVTTEANSS